MRPLSIFGIVFDFDGTLAVPSLDFHEMNQAAINAVAALMPCFPEKQEPALEWLKKVYAAAEAEQGENFAVMVRNAAYEAMSQVEVTAARKAGLFSGVRELLENLKKKKIETAIITRNCKKAVKAALPDAATILTCILTRDDISRWKPDPTHLKTALEQMRVSPEHALMVGDDPMDILVGKKCNTHTAAVFCGHASENDLQLCGPDFTAENTVELIHKLEASGLLQP